MFILGIRATDTFRLIVNGLDVPGAHRRIGDGKNGFMPLSVECIDACSRGLIYSLAHYSEQNGDLMCDPEMTFLFADDGGIVPLSFRNDFIGVDQVAASVDKLENWLFNGKLQRDLALFAEDWLKNIAEQQNLGC